MEQIPVLRILYVYYRTYTCLTDTEVPVGTTGLILILPIHEYPQVLLDLYLFYRTYTPFTNTKVPVGPTEIHYTEVPVGTTGLILILPIREYP